MVRAALAFCLLLAAGQEAAAGVFNISNDQFLKDGKPFQVLSCSMHYHRIPPEYWKEVLRRLHAMGCNSIETYVPWNYHETQEGVVDFSSPEKNLAQFIQDIHEEGLLLFFRAGPYICSEWDWGGLPAWLGWYGASIRTYEPIYIKYASRHLTQVHKIAKPFLYSNGGPIVMIQIENEYGLFGDVQQNPKDMQYLKHLANLTRTNMGSDVLLYTTDPARSVGKGTIPGPTVVSLADHGPGSFDQPCQVQAEYNPVGKNPCMDTEFYTGWITRYGENFQNYSTQKGCDSLDTALSKGYSVNLYMGAGGTNFGFWSGATGGGSSYFPTITSYDWDSGVGENGDHGYGSDGKDKYIGLQTVFKKFNKEPLPQEPPPRRRDQYPPVRLVKRVGLTDPAVLRLVSSLNITSPTFQSMQDLKQDYGIVIYSHKLTTNGGNLSLSDYVSDFAVIAVDGKLQGSLYRPNKPEPVNVQGAAGSELQLVVENMGRMNFGGGMKTDIKGIPSSTQASLDGRTLSSWDIRVVPLNDTTVFSSLPWQPLACTDVAAPAGPAFYEGVLTISGTPTDTYISTKGFTKGYIWVNGKGLGMYWNQGPQHALYIPAPWLRQGENPVVFLEFEKVPRNCSAEMRTEFDFSGPKPPSCKPPKAGLQTTMYTCDAGNEVQGWSMSQVGSEFTLALGDLCLTSPADTNPPAYATVETCDPSSDRQKFHMNGQELVSSASLCLDVWGNNHQPGAKADFYPCSKGTNQRWSPQMTPGHVTQVVSLLNQYCLTACLL